MMEAEALGLVEERGRVSGARYRHAGAECEIAANLVIARTGRRSVLRDESNLPLHSLGAPMDVFWFRIPKPRSAENETTVAAANILAGPMAEGQNRDPLLPTVQARRLPAVRAVQSFQNAAQKRIVGRLLAR